MQIRLKANRLKIAALLILLIIPAVLAADVLLGGRHYGVISLIVVVLTMVPFFVLFENRKPKARELVPIAVMSAVAVVGRFAFAAVPQFKPIVAIVIITALAFGAEAGFLTGAVSMLVSNFFFGQGPWTPWQMFCCGIIGFIAGLLRQKGLLKSKISVCIFGFISGYLYGFIVDTWTVTSVTSQMTWQSILSVYIMGLPSDTVLAAATAAFLFILEKPLVKKLLRIKMKFGLIE